MLLKGTMLLSVTKERWTAYVMVIFRIKYYFAFVYRRIGI